MTATTPALDVADLNVTFTRHATRAVRGMSFTVQPGRTVAIVGASGSGKTTACRAVLRLLPPTSRITGSIRLAGRELVGLTDSAMQAHRGSGISMVFQNPDRSLNPTMRIGDQIVEALRIGVKKPRHELSARARDLLGQTGFSEPERIFRSYPHQMSGGMRQRAVIAIALSREPGVLVADEPTTALDVTTQAAIMSTLVTLQQRTGLAIVLVSHDVALACAYADDIVVMHGGRLVETFASSAVHADERRAQTGELVRAAEGVARARTITAPHGPSPAHSASNVLEIRAVSQKFPASARADRNGGSIQAVAGVTFDIRRGETLALVGESGSGKSTLAQSILDAPTPTEGEIRVGGVSLSALNREARRKHLRDVQIVLQNPLTTIDPTWKISTVVAEPLRAFGREYRASRRARVNDVLALVGLDPKVWSHRRRNELSGGQAQQVAIARALASRPSLIILDEAVSSLDPITKAGILTLLENLQNELGLAYLFIAHDLGVVRRVSDRVAVMYQGKICEIGPTNDVLQAPRHPYSAALRADDPALEFGRDKPRPEPRPKPLALTTPISGCTYQSRCLQATQLCQEVEPPMRTFGPDHTTACHFPLTRSPGSHPPRTLRIPRLSDEAQT